VIIQELEAGAAYTATVTAFNKKGTSLVRHILVETLQPPESQLVEEKLEQAGAGQGAGLAWQLGGGVLAGSTLSLALITGTPGVHSLNYISCEMLRFIFISLIFEVRLQGLP
jgi:hypothetical protein